MFLEILEKLQMIAILPTNYKFRQYEKTTYDFQEKWQAYVQSRVKKTTAKIIFLSIILRRN